MEESEEMPAPSRLKRKRGSTRPSRISSSSRQIRASPSDNEEMKDAENEHEEKKSEEKPKASDKTPSEKTWYHEFEILEKQVGNSVVWFAQIPKIQKGSKHTELLVDSFYKTVTGRMEKSTGPLIDKRVCIVLSVLNFHFCCLSWTNSCFFCSSFRQNSKNLALVIFYSF